CSLVVSRRRAGVIYPRLTPRACSLPLRHPDPGASASGRMTAAPQTKACGEDGAVRTDTLWRHIEPFAPVGWECLDAGERLRLLLGKQYNT
ncbi:MAG TPA: hypothetical protein VFU63_01830, partial [Ktedonobacterales bacterium]|nr:hypothetical protein [Ktedonobacterales bacterium]